MKHREMEDILMKNRPKTKIIISKKEILNILHGICFLHASFLLFRYIYCFILLKKTILCNNPFYLFLFFLLPILVWIVSTSEDFFNYRNRKMSFLNFYTILSIFTIMQPFYTFLWKGIIPWVLKLKPNAALSESMILWMGRIFVFTPLIFTASFLSVTLLKVFHSLEGRDRIYRFKISKYLDVRKDKDVLYDFKTVIRDLHTGKCFPLKEEDLRTGVLLNGPSGTGKTSSVIIPIVKDIMDQKAKNFVLREQKAVEFVEKEDAILQYKKADFTEKIHEEGGFLKQAIRPKEGMEERFEDIFIRYRDAGITVMAPNNGYIRDVLRLAKARSIKVNVLDPACNWEREFPGIAKVKKINPFYIPENLTKEEQMIAINNRASVFSEVLVALNEQNKEGEMYFRDINLAMTGNIATVIMSANAILKRQTEILEIQAAIDDPTLLEGYLAVIEKEYDIIIETSGIAAKNKQSKGAKEAMAIQRIRYAMEHDITEFDFPSPFALMEKTVQRNRDNPLFHACQFVRDEVLSEEGRKKMYDQARGLRNLLSLKLLNDTRITDILSAKTDEELLDFDRILSDGEVTVVNTAVEFASGLSTAFGLFFQLNLKTAIFRRDPKNKSNPPHFLIIDEVSQYVHPFYNDIVSFYRQYNIISVLSIQSLTQLESKESTKYLSTLFQSIGTHIVYGRLSGREMKIYEEMSGEELEEMIQAGTSYNSIFSKNPSITKSDRITPKRVPSISGSEMRYRNFQEVIVFTARNGDVLKPFAAKVSFLSPECFCDYPYPNLHWEKYLPEEIAPVAYEYDDENILTNTYVPPLKPVEIREDITGKARICEDKKTDLLIQSEFYEEEKTISKEEMEKFYFILYHAGEKKDDASEFDQFI